MNTPNEDGKPSDNVELPKQEGGACGPGCSCNAGGSSGRTRWVIGAIVLVAAGIMVVRAVVKNGEKPAQACCPAGYAAPCLTPATPAGKTDAAAKSGAAAPAAEASVGTAIGTFAELNTLAAKTDAVFIYLPGKATAAGKAPATPMKNAAKMMEDKGVKCGLFTLKADSADYGQLTGQVSLPAVLAMVKGRGMSAISGEVTESKLVQGYVSASSAGGCGPSGCGPSGCK